MTTPAKDTAKFVFKGTVKKLKAANLKAITDTAKTVVVHVEEVIRAPQALAGFAGHDVTLQPAKGERLRKGQQAVFYTNGWIYGENLAVQSLGHEAVKARSGPALMAAAAPADPARAAHQQEIRQRAEAAPVVLSGKVIAVGLPSAPAPTTPAAAASAAAPPAGRRPISEHDPFWSEAVIEVEKVHKGQTSQKRVVVRFPRSTDVRWYQAPKFQVGQEGVFILHPDEGAVTGHPVVGAAAAALAPEGTYTCLGPADFQPADHQPEVAAAVTAAEG